MEYLTYSKIICSHFQLIYNIISLTNTMVNYTKWCSNCQSRSNKLYYRKEGKFITTKKLYYCSKCNIIYTAKDETAKRINLN